MKKLLSLLLTVSMLLTLGALAETTPDPVVIAVCLPLSGTNSDSGRMGSNGAQLAVDYFNELGGIHSLGGAEIILELYDTTSEVDQSKSVLERALATEGVVAAIGCGTSAITLPAIPAAEKAQIPLITYSNAAELTNQGYQFIFSISPLAVDIGSSMPEFLMWLNDEKGYSYKKVAIVYQDNSKGISAAEGYRTKAESYGLEVVYDASFEPNLTDATSIATAIKSSGAECIMIDAFNNDNKLIVDAMNSINYHPLWLGVSCWTSFGEDMGDAANGMIAQGNWNYKNSTVLASEEYVAITERFKEEYGYNMDEQCGSAFACVELIVNALEKSGSYDPVVLRDTIRNNTFDSIHQPGQVQFDENGINVLATVGVNQWQYGECVCIWPDDLKGADFIAPADF